MEYNRNFILAIVLSFGLIWSWQFFFPTQQNKNNAQTNKQTLSETNSPIPSKTQNNTQNINLSEIPVAQKAQAINRVDAIKEDERIIVNTPSLIGSINLKGASFDDLLLKKYHVSIAKDSPYVDLLNPAGLKQSYFAEFGFASSSIPNALLPQSNTQWKVIGEDKTLTPNHPITLSYDNHEGLIFQRQITVDDNYMFTIKDSVTNKGATPVTLSNYARIARANIPDHATQTYLLHEGLIGMIGDEGLQSEKYTAMEKLDNNAQKKQINFKNAEGGWIGITDKYWAVVAIPQQDLFYTSRFNYFKDLNAHFQSDFLTDSYSLQSGETKTFTNRLFAGAKQVDIIDNYQNDLHIKKFELLIDWGLFSFITKPMFALIDFLYKFLGNFGLAILLVTVILKILTFPLANKSYKSMAKMKLLQPKIAQIKTKYKDPVEQQKATLELYRVEKINPLAGCWPTLIQLPIFFALYKVLYITIEMRHAPFYGWIHDLAAPDPTSIFNLFGLLPYYVPHFLMVGAWPIIMGITMFLQMRMNPAPVDSTQAAIFNWMPLIFTFMLAAFPVGLVIYWAWNNTLTIIQQAVIMKRQGVKIELWSNLKSVFTKKQ